jgi:hypothetical protein
MAEVNLQDDSIKRYVVSRHQFDAKTNHFRWVAEIAFDNKRQWKKYLNSAFSELAEKKEHGAAHYKEQLTGFVFEPGYLASSERNHGTILRKRSIFQRILRPKIFLPAYKTSYAEYETLKREQGIQ